LFYELGEEKLEIFDKGRSQDEAYTERKRSGTDTGPFVAGIKGTDRNGFYKRKN
jgi:hypothetical protein